MMIIMVSSDLKVYDYLLDKGTSQELGSYYSVKAYLTLKIDCSILR